MKINFKRDDWTLKYDVHAKETCQVITQFSNYFYHSTLNQFTLYEMNPSMTDTHLRPNTILTTLQQLSRNS